MNKTDAKLIYSSLNEVTGLEKFLILDSKLELIAKFGEADADTHEGIISLIRELHALLFEFTKDAQLEKYHEILQETESGILYLLVSTSQKYIFVITGTEAMKIGMIKVKMEKIIQSS